jgi:uncharacterized membrane protein
LTGARPSPGGASTTGLDPHVAAALSYLAGPFSGVLLLLAERTNPHVRFHAWQSLVALGGLWVLGLVLYLLAFAALFVSATAFRLLLWLAVLVWAGWVVLWVICLVKAYRGEPFRLPLVAGFAERRADAVRRP